MKPDITIYITFTVVGEAASYLKTTYILIVILVTFLNGNAVTILKKKLPKLLLFLHKKYLNFHSYYWRCVKNVQFYAFKRAYTLFSYKALNTRSYIFDTMFLNIHVTKCQKKKSVAISSRLRYVSS